MPFTHLREGNDITSYSIEKFLGEIKRHLNERFTKYYVTVEPSKHETPQLFRVWRDPDSNNYRWEFNIVPKIKLTPYTSRPVSQTPIYFSLSRIRLLGELEAWHRGINMINLDLPAIMALLFHRDSKKAARIDRTGVSTLVFRDGVTRDTTTAVFMADEDNPAPKIDLELNDIEPGLRLAHITKALGDLLKNFLNASML